MFPSVRDGCKWICLLSIRSIMHLKTRSIHGKKGTFTSNINFSLSLSFATLLPTHTLSNSIMKEFFFPLARSLARYPLIKHTGITNSPSLLLEGTSPKPLIGAGLLCLMRILIITMSSWPSVDSVQEIQIVLFSQHCITAVRLQVLFFCFQFFVLIQFNVSLLQFARFWFMYLIKTGHVTKYDFCIFILILCQVVERVV